MTRLSIGVQSFDDAKLAALGRVHDATQARAAVAEAKAAFATFNLDLMYALPRQTLAECEADLAAALAFEPPHLSIYHLTIEPNTYFARFPPRVPDADLAAAMLDRIVARRTGRTRLYDFRVRSPRPRARQTSTTGNRRLPRIGAGARAELCHRIARQSAARPLSYMLRDAARRSRRNRGRARGPAFEFMLHALRLKEGFEISASSAHRCSARIEAPLADPSGAACSARSASLRPPRSLAS